jgi:hypothetical protein
MSIVRRQQGCDTLVIPQWQNSHRRMSALPVIYRRELIAKPRLSPRNRSRLIITTSDTARFSTEASLGERRLDVVEFAAAAMAIGVNPVRIFTGLVKQLTSGQSAR